MAAVANLKQQTQSKDYIPFGQSTAYKAFHGSLIKFEQKCTAEKEPFCRKCAIDDWNDRYTAKLKEVQRQAISHRDKEIVETIEFNSELDLEDYTDSHFALKDETVKEWETKQGKFMKSYYLNYVCKKYGYGHCINLNDTDYDAWKQKQDKGKKA